MGQATVQALGADAEFQPRRYRRARVSGFIGDISWGNTVIGGVVEDISRNGFKVSDLPREFADGCQLCRVVLSGHGRHFRLLVTPRWEKEADDASRVEVGFKILDSSWDWLEFTGRVVPDVTELYRADLARTLQ